MPSKLSSSNAPQRPPSDPNAEHSVTIVRTIKASADELYAAWTEPAIMRTWLATIVDADVRVGGAYRIENHEANGSVNAFTGQYVVLDPGKRILQTFSHASTEPDTYVDEFVEITFRSLGPRLTELSLTNGWNGFGFTAEEGDALKEGWSQWLDLLEGALGTREASAS